MRDSEFKLLEHCCDGYLIFSKGEEIEKNYSPDFALNFNEEYILIEHEKQPNRKTIVADIFKAGYFLQNDRSGILIIIMIPKGKSSFESYIKHVLKYYKWIKSHTNLTDVYFVKENEYLKDGLTLKIKGNDFIKNSISLNSFH
ncbi:hypothetical protein [Flavobacterium aquiphilum]|uniref:hypothetical protein n=1 Tax=Flavobacterium aquiphilum TaxID=3003261 RepID=UPI00248125C9|nr:hypothetical protein [Flavobacterium aquiphilum]